MPLYGRNPRTGQLESVDGLAPGEQLGGEGYWLAPGLVDLQVNGFAGVDFNSPEAGIPEYRYAVQRLWATGVTSLLPTIITGSTGRIAACLKNAARAAEDPLIGPAIAGVHLEGPYISPEDGPRGAHPRQFVRSPNREEFFGFQDASGGRIRLVTVAPEVPGALPFIEWLVSQGIVVSIGHTAASEETIRDAVKAGACMSTHLGNGAHSTIPRHHNYIWEQLAADELHASLIVDGHHLPPGVVKVFVRAKGLEHSVLITDAVAPAGCEPGPYEIGETSIELTPSGRVQLRGAGDQEGRLAGSSLLLNDAVGNTVRFAGISLADALAMASRNAIAVGGLPRRFGDRIVFSWDAAASRLRICLTACAGKVVYRADDAPTIISRAAPAESPRL